ncbi:MAG: alpha/beta fold hydrolase, partial [Bacteroidales bacterium]|nr:alpha/beta fold hydrolase [Bacteroidales bacterium]
MQSHKIIVKDFHFEAGGHLDTVDVLYHTSDREYAKGDKVVWICHALTGNSDPQDWWPGLVGPGKFIDPDKYYVVCVNMLGSPYGTSSPASINPATGKPFYFDFPRVTVRDICKCNFAVMDYLGIERVDILMGPSIGGFQALEMSIMQPER